MLSNQVKLDVLKDELEKCQALGGYMAGVTVSGVLWAIFQNNAGGAWDNAKKSFEAGVEINGEMTYKGSEAHKASVTGDTVGDPAGDAGGESVVGDTVGVPVGDAVGATVVGDTVGDPVGDFVGDPVGGTVGVWTPLPRVVERFLVCRAYF